MRFISAHKLTSYLMVVFAFLALALSGELNPLVVALSTLAVIGSWFWEEPRVKLGRYATVWAVLSLLVLGLTLLRAFMSSEFLVVGVEYLLFLLIAKLFNRNACRDYLHIYVLTFLMLVAATVLNPEISYGLFFLGYVLSTTWALILFHLRREMEENFLLKHSEDRASEPVQVTRILNSRRIVGRRFFVGTAALSLGVFAASSVLFLTIPRIGFGLFSQKRQSGISMAGFSEQVKLGGHGTIKSDNTVVMRVKLDAVYGTGEVPPLHWRGVAFDVYENGQWRRSRIAPHTTRQTDYLGRSRDRYHLLYAQPRVNSNDELEGRLDGTLRQEVYLEPISEDVLFGASMPEAFELESHPGGRRFKPRRSQNDEFRIPHNAGLKYVVYSHVDPPSPALLRTAPAQLPRGYELYLQLPPEITDRVRALARDITRDAPTAYDKAVAIEAWLESNLSYTLEMRDPGSQEPIDFFLFDRRQGHCEYFASAMSIMLRTLEIPTRNVNGFLSGEWNEYENYMAVRARDAHSWVEVYFHGAGWVTFDPTPPSSEAAEGPADGLADRVRRFLDTLRFQWFQWVIEYDLNRQMSLFRGVGDSVKESSLTAKEVLGDIRAWFGRHRLTLAWVALGALVLALLAVLWRRRDRRSRIARSRDPMTALYERVLVNLARRGHPRGPATTPREHAARLAADSVPGAAELVELTTVYYASRYGGNTDPALLERAGALAHAIDRALREAPPRPKADRAGS
ncbi:transglutaminase TgpA family protein [Haliangium sp.]|uniref:transglutaminase TgpA family protein n=1 Tax=Haliangium sp. TaxID=2663208 RepID=UPI003D0E7798